ncbi:MAG: hypothetical protein Q9160_002644 [Pyrenula sp. 1 TL-2023]
MDTETDPPRKGPVSKDALALDRSQHLSRQSSAIRKASATCSRRSSISSVHSHHSAVSAHGGFPSPSLAQHLRRASIIETRKARLADKAAHAEKVRLRAAIAKASSRPTYREERAAAAKAAREKLLAEIAAKCEEQVRRAKKIAEENREKKAAEQARAKEEKTEKLAEAARRRNLYQQASRRARPLAQASQEDAKAPGAESRTLHDEEAARIIQRTWRYYQLSVRVHVFQELAISMESCRRSTFENLGRLLSDHTVLSRTTKLLEYLGLIELGISSMPDIGSSTRVFLSSFLIVSFPEQVLSHGSQDPHEQNLMAKAQDLLTVFERCLTNRVGSLRDPQKWDSDRDLLLTAFTEFSCVFHSWKSHDSSSLVQMMVSQFVELDLILQKVKDDHAGGVSEDYSSAIRQNQIQILARLKRFLGSEEALTMIKAAVRKARKAQNSQNQRRTEPIPPRAISAAGTVPADSLSGSASSAEHLVSTNEGLVESRSNHSKSLSSAFQRIMTPIPPNRELSHEIQVNGSYEITQSAWTQPRQQIMEMMCSNMRHALSEGGSRATADWTQSMAHMIRDKLMALVTPRYPLYEKLDQMLDLQLIHQTTQAGLFSFDEFFSSIADISAQICSQGRDEIVKAFAEDEEPDVFARLLKLVKILDLMTLDHINWALRVAVPVILDHGHEHESKAFEHDISDGKHALTKLQRFWVASRESLASDSTTRYGNSIYYRGLVDLVFSNRPLRYSSLPETLHLDWHRLSALRSQAFRTVATASTLLTTKVRLRRNRETQWRTDASRILSLDFASTDASRIISIIESSHIMPEATREGVLSFIKRVLPSAKAATDNYNLIVQRLEASRLDGDSPSASFEHLDSSLQEDVFSEQVATFMLKALREHVFERLSATSVADRVRTTTNTAEVLGRAGMPEFSSEVTGWVDTLGRVKKVDLKSHERWYDEVAGGRANSAEARE